MRYCSSARSAPAMSVAAQPVLCSCPASLMIQTAAWRPSSSLRAGRSQRRGPLALLPHALDCDDRGGIRRHREQAARAVRRHRDVILLVRRRWNGVDARRMRALLVLRYQGGSGDLRQHEAGVEPRLGRDGHRLWHDADPGAGRHGSDGGRRACAQRGEERPGKRAERERNRHSFSSYISQSRAPSGRSSSERVRHVLSYRTIAVTFHCCV